MPEKPTTAAYLASYGSQLLGRSLTPAERILIEEVMLDFMLDEVSFAARHGVAGIRASLQTLMDLTPAESLDAAARISKSIVADVAELEARLARQEMANDRMREHLVMTSEELRRASGVGRSR